MLCYLLVNNKLTNSELKNIKEESAQYSSHVVGLVINSLNKTVIIADWNGALIGDSGFEITSPIESVLESRP